jgi:ankyrin repeat protein
VACIANQLTTAEALLRMGADPSLPNALGQSALVLSVQHGHTEVAKLLIESDSNNLLLNLGDLNQMLPMHWACARGHLNTMNLLLQLDDRRKMIDSTDGFGRTSSMLAASSGNLQCLLVRKSLPRSDKHFFRSPTPLPN